MYQLDNLHGQRKKKNSFDNDKKRILSVQLKEQKRLPMGNVLEENQTPNTGYNNATKINFVSEARTLVKDVRAHCYSASLVPTLYMACHVKYFKRAHRVETQQNIELMTFSVT